MEVWEVLRKKVGRREKGCEKTNSSENCESGKEKDGMVSAVRELPKGSQQEGRRKRPHLRLQKRRPRQRKRRVNPGRKEERLESK